LEIKQQQDYKQKTSSEQKKYNNTGESVDG
jgi:hypothetical protein